MSQHKICCYICVCIFQIPLLHTSMNLSLGQNKVNNELRQSNRELKTSNEGRMENYIHDEIKTNDTLGRPECFCQGKDPL